MNRRASFLFVSSLIVLTSLSAAENPAERIDRLFAARESRAQALAGGTTVTTDAPMTGIVPPEGIRFVVGESKGSYLELVWDEGKPTRLAIAVRDSTDKYCGDIPELKKAGRVTISNACVQVGGLIQSVRPELGPFRWAGFNANWGRGSLFPHYYDMYLGMWQTLPDAKSHVCDLRFDTSDGVHAYFDGSYRGVVHPPKGNENARLKEIRYSFAKGATFLPKSAPALVYDRDRFTVLDFAANPRAKAFVGAKMEGNGADGVRALPGGVPVRIAKPIDSADVAICHEAAGFCGLSWNNYMGRDPRQGYGGEIHYRLPAKAYAKAHVVFALDDAKSECLNKAKDRYLTLRLSRYCANGLGLNSTAEAVLDYTKGVPADLAKVGAVTRGGKTYPLYYAELPIDLSPILDMVARRGFERTKDGWVAGDWLDVDLCGRTDGITVRADSDSAFNVFGLTLETAPVCLDFKSRPGAPGNIFTLDEGDRRLWVSLLADLSGAKGEVAWTARDVASGRISATGSFAYGPLAKGETAERRIDLDFADDPGVYEVTFDVDGVCRVSTRFAIVVPSGRKATPEASPYETWCFFGAHGTPASWELNGPILQKAGIAKTNVRPLPAEVTRTYGVTSTGFVMAPHQREFDETTGRFKDHDGLSGEDWFVADIKKQIASQPFTDHIMIWHETAPGNEFPEELLDLPVPPATEKDKIAAKYVNEVGRLVRKHFPKLRIQIGNSGKSFGAACRPFRGGADPQYYDSIGIESGMASKFPEVMHVCGVQGLMVAVDCASRYAKRKVPASACYEFVNQANTILGERRQAEWYVRDALVCLAHGMTLVPIGGGVCDSNGAYFDSVWGKNGFLFRAPYLQPKLAYVAIAAITKALDGVTVVRELDTGSSTVYAVLFKRCDGRYATALWCARGEAEFELDVSGGGEVMDMLGRSSSLGFLGLWGKTVTAGESPAYVVTENPVEAVKVVSRTFPDDAAFLAAGGAEVARLARADQVTVRPDPRAASRRPKYFWQLPFLKPSDRFTVAEVDDPEKGRCLEVALAAPKERENPYFTDFTTLHLREPAVVAKPCRQLGIWVKGNSNWASVCFEIEDAKGETYTTFYVRDTDWKSLEWGNWSMWVNFDGWTIASCAFEKGPWERVGDTTSPCGGNVEIAFPIKVKAVTVEMNRRNFGLTGYTPTDPKIRLGAIVTSDRPGLAIPRVSDEYTK